MFKEGDVYLYFGDSSDINSIRRVLFIKQLGEYTVEVKEIQHDLYFTIMPLELIPLEYEEKLYKVVSERQRLKKVYDDSIRLVFQLRNEITRNNLEK